MDKKEDRKSGDQTTLQRTLEIMIHLSQPGGRTIDALSDDFGVHRRTIQRTIRTIRDAGYVVINNQGRYKIDHEATKAECSFDIGDLLHFTKEEAWMLNEAICKIPGENVIKENLVKKLYSVYSSETIIENIKNQQDSEQVRIIMEAIQNEFQVKIKEYTHASDNKHITESLAEPIAFASDYSRVWAFLVPAKKNILLRLSGLNGVEPTYSPYQFSQHHKKGDIDVFRGYGYSLKPVHLKLNRKAYGFICEEFPMAKPLAKITDPFYYELKTEVYDYAPVKRFCLGLPGDAEVIGPEELVNEIRAVYQNPVQIHKTRSAITYFPG